MSTADSDAAAAAKRAAAAERQRRCRAQGTSNTAIARAARKAAVHALLARLSPPVEPPSQDQLHQIPEAYAHSSAASDDAVQQYDNNREWTWRAVLAIDGDPSCSDSLRFLLEWQPTAGREWRNSWVWASAQRRSSLRVLWEWMAERDMGKEEGRESWGCMIARELHIARTT